MSTQKPDAPAERPSQAGSAGWLLRIPGGDVFGPSPASTLVAWAEQGRIEPGSWISIDGKSWRPAEDLASLGMDWIIELDAARQTGPFNIRAVHGFLEDGSITAATILRNRRTGERAPVAAKIPSLAAPRSAERPPAGKTTQTDTGIAEARRQIDSLRSELAGARELAAAAESEAQAARAERDNLKASLGKEREAREAALRAASDAAVAQKAQNLATEEQARRREAKFKTDLGAAEQRITTLAAQVDQKESELTDTHAHMVRFHALANDLAAKVSAGEAECAALRDALAKEKADRLAIETGLRETIDRERSENLSIRSSLQERVEAERARREQQESLYRREQAEGAAFRLAAGQREMDLKSRIAGMEKEASLTVAERDAARRSEAEAATRAAEAERAAEAAKAEAVRRVDAAASARAAAERETDALRRQADTLRSDLRTATERLQTATSAARDLEKERDRLAGALHAANTELKSLPAKVGQLASDLAETTAQREAARRGEATLAAALAERDAALAAALADAARSAEAMRNERATSESQRDAARRSGEEMARRLADAESRERAALDALDRGRRGSAGVAETGGMGAVHELQRAAQSSAEELRALRDRTGRERDEAREAILRIESERNSLSARLREQESALRVHTGNIERLQATLRQKESEMSDLDRLVGEYRNQIRILADKCAQVESAAKAEKTRSSTSRPRKGKPMDATEWNVGGTQEKADHAQGHPLAGIEAKAAKELLDWHKAKNGKRA